MKVGYARVSTLEQNPELQFDSLRSADCEKIFQDKASGAKAERPGLTEAMAYLRKGGRKEKLTAKQVETLRKMAESRQHSVMEICRLLSISKPTYYRYLRVDHDR